MPEQAGRPRSGSRGRLLASGSVLGAALVLGCPVPASAEVAGPTAQCQVTDPRLAELSGLVAVDDQMVAINDGGEQVSVFLLDAACQVGDVHTAAVDPYDPEDLAVAADGTVWLADTGDNNANRPTVALIALRPDGTTSVYRLTYPDGPHDAEALLLAPDGTPYLVTKEILGASGVYTPASPLVDGGTVALARAAAVNMTFTGTAGGPVGQAGQLLVTGGAVARDGSAFALRTYTDAYVWTLSGSDIPTAFAAAPVRIPLPDSPQGEAISFAADNRNLLVASEGLPSEVTVVPLAAETVASMTTPVEGPAPSLTDLGRSGLSPITNALIAAAVATVVVWIGGKLRRDSSHRRPAERRP
ncbi:hypothetical protein [Blastococcus sp. CT_GayMR16]|uniref:hypothetical protein n=1 Tax=Blastococcus sp. CT_GayMR16 TaxID=2559607 RepID=UPI001073ECD2|nr:hypothetical protein [Blastococcus sp. CT_GayMR16]TFV86832.1 hypothetical protein E4P38_15830 [Blastococcus sp. CT_GayMR16]